MGHFGEMVSLFLCCPQSQHLAISPVALVTLWNDPVTMSVRGVRTTTTALSLHTERELRKHTFGGCKSHLWTVCNSGRQPGLERKTSEASGAKGLGMAFGNVCEKLQAVGGPPAPRDMHVWTHGMLTRRPAAKLPKQGRDANSRAQVLFAPHKANGEGSGQRAHVPPTHISCVPSTV